jgi:hypothetical protein
MKEKYIEHSRKRYREDAESFKTLGICDEQIVMGSNAYRAINTAIDLGDRTLFVRNRYNRTGFRDYHLGSFGFPDVGVWFREALNSPEETEEYKNLLKIVYPWMVDGIFDLRLTFLKVKMAELDPSSFISEIKLDRGDHLDDKPSVVEKIKSGLKRGRRNFVQNRFGAITSKFDQETVGKACTNVAVDERKAALGFGRGFRVDFEPIGNGDKNVQKLSERLGSWVQNNNLGRGEFADKMTCVVRVLQAK